MHLLSVSSMPQDIPVTTPGGLWTTIQFTVEDLDTGHHHKDTGGASVCNGGVNGAVIVGGLVCRFEEFDGGSQLQVRSYFVADDGTGQRLSTGKAIDEKPAQTHHDDLPHDDPDHRVAVTHAGYPIAVVVPEGMRLRLEASQQHNTSGFAVGRLAVAELVATIYPL